MKLEMQSMHQPDQRNHSVDFMKGILVILMIAAHVVQFFPCGKIADLFSAYVNLTTFSGFMFTFGFVCYTTYIEKSEEGGFLPLLSFLWIRASRAIRQSLKAN